MELTADEIDLIEGLCHGWSNEDKDYVTRIAGILTKLGVAHEIKATTVSYGEYHADGTITREITHYSIERGN